MSWPLLIALVRHGESDGNILEADERASLPISTQDFRLTERGRKQAEITGKYLQDYYEFDVFYTSYYQRSKETMSIMFPKAKAYEDPRIAEAQRGIWNSLTKAEIDKYYPGEELRKRKEGFYHYRPPGGENWPDVELRIHSFLGTLSRDCDRQSVLIVAHGNWMILFQKLIHHFSIEQVLEFNRQGKFENASVTIYRTDMIPQSRLVLERENKIPWAEKL